MEIEKSTTLEESTTIPIEVPRTRIIQKMPDLDMLEAFMTGMLGGASRVVFSLERGQFEWTK